MKLPTRVQPFGILPEKDRLEIYNLAEELNQVLGQIKEEGEDYDKDRQIYTYCCYDADRFAFVVAIQYCNPIISFIPGGCRCATTVN